MWFWANDSKHRHIIYRWKSFFATMNNSRLLPGNKASFGMDQLSKFWQFFSKSVIVNLVFSSRIEGTIMTRRTWGIDSCPETAMGVPEMAHHYGSAVAPTHASPTAVSGTSAGEQLLLGILAPPEALSPERVRRGSSGGMERVVQPWKRERKWGRKRIAMEERKKEEERERGLTWEGGRMTARTSRSPKKMALWPWGTIGREGEEIKLLSLSLLSWLAYCGQSIWF